MHQQGFAGPLPAMCQCENKGGKGRWQIAWFYMGPINATWHSANATVCCRASLEHLEPRHADAPRAWTCLAGNVIKTSETVAFPYRPSLPGVCDQQVCALMSRDAGPTTRGITRFRCAPCPPEKMLKFHIASETCFFDDDGALTHQHCNWGAV